MIVRSPCIPHTRSVGKLFAPHRDLVSLIDSHSPYSIGMPLVAPSRVGMYPILCWVGVYPVRLLSPCCGIGMFSMLGGVGRFRLIAVSHMGMGFG